MLLLLASIVASAIFSRRYLRPVIQAFDLMKSQKISELPKVKIPEIDDLIEFLSTTDEAAHPTGVTHEDPSAKPFPPASFHSFVEHISTLSVAERAVFDLYMKGHTAKEIADILCLSINTIKTHNKRIYMKLGVSSRKELLVYVQMMEETHTPPPGETELKTR